MRAKQFFISTQKEAPADAEIVSQKLMLRAGMIRKLAAGVYNYMPMGLRSLKKIERIVREEMDRAGAIELLMPIVQPAELWQETGRWQKYGSELLRFKDRHDRDFVLQPTSEEVVTDIARQEIKSWRQLPVNFYQIQTKFRDERRPRFGVMRGRDFVMKDAYSFDRTAEDAGFPDFGPMRKAEQRARTTGKLLRDGAVPMMGTELEELQKGNDSDVKPNVMLDFLVPIMILVATAIWTYIAKGGVKILECFIITVIYMSIELSIRKVFKSVTDLVSTAVQGMKSVMSATLILALAYCINTITKSMGAADFLLGVCESWMTPALFLSVTFIAGAVISFFTGSSWGTFAICIPIAVPMAYSFTGGQLGTLVYAAVGAVVSGGLFGDHCSPVSDTSVLSSLGAACDHIDHVRTQLPYALLAAAVSIILWIVVALVGGAA